MAKTVTRLALLCTLCLMASYLEALLPAFTAVPGLKLGLSNSLVTLLIAHGRPKQGAAVNLGRILLAAFLFTGVSTLPYALCGAACSGLTVWALARARRYSLIGLCAAGGFVHNAAQLAVCAVLYGSPAVIRSGPVLLLAGIFCGCVVGSLALLLHRRLGDRLIF